MPNYNIFSNLRNPVTTVDIGATSAENGLNYRVTTSVQTIAANGFLAVQLSNPTTSRYTARIGRIFGGAITNTAVYLIRNATVVGGITITPVNTNFGFTSASQLIATFSISTTNPSTGGATFSTIIQASGPIENDELGKIVVPPNTRLIVDVQNLTNQANTLAITVGWGEVSPVS